MSEVTLKNRIGIFLILGHFGALLLVLAMGMLGNFLIREQMMTAIAIIAPLFAGYTTAIIKYIIKTRNEPVRDDKPLSGPFVFVTWLLPGLFVALIWLQIILAGIKLGPLADYENFKLMLGATETIFGIYVGQLIFSIFEKAPEPAAKPEAGKLRKR